MLDPRRPFKYGFMLRQLDQATLAVHLPQLDLLAPDDGNRLAFLWNLGRL